MELLVRQAPIKVKSQKYVSVQIERSEEGLRKIVKEAGAKSDGKERLWRMPQRLAGILSLTDRLKIA